MGVVGAEEEPFPAFAAIINADLESFFLRGDDDDDSSPLLTLLPRPYLCSGVRDRLLGLREVVRFFSGFRSGFPIDRLRRTGDFTADESVAISSEDFFLVSFVGVIDRLLEESGSPDPIPPSELLRRTPRSFLDDDLEPFFFLVLVPSSPLSSSLW